jgi:hypothetical protein
MKEISVSFFIFASFLKSVILPEPTPLSPEKPFSHLLSRKRREVLTLTRLGNLFFAKESL